MRLNDDDFDFGNGNDKNLVRWFSVCYGRLPEFWFFCPDCYKVCYHDAVSGQGGHQCEVRPIIVERDNAKHP